MKIKRWLFGIQVVCVAILTIIAAQIDVNATQLDATSPANNFYFSNFTADYYLTKADDGTSKLHVKEVLTAEFDNSSQNHGIIRVIPRTNQSGANQVVANERSLNLQVQQGDEPAHIDHIVDGDDAYTIYIGDPNQFIQGTQVYTLEYDFSDVITEFTADDTNVSGQPDVAKAWQELYWDTNGTGWSQRFDQVTANLHLPDDIKDHVTPDINCYTGAYSSINQSRCQIKKTADGFTFTAENLKAGENLTFDVTFDPDTFYVVLEKNYAVIIFLILELLIGGALLVSCILRWRKTAQKQQKMYKSSFIAPEYLPPRDLSVAEGAKIYLKKTQSTYVPTLLEMAIKRKISIIGDDEKHWKIVLQRPFESFSAPEQDMLQILADGLPMQKGTTISVEQHTATRTLANYALNYDKDTYKLLVKKDYFIDKKPPMKASTLAVVMIFVAIWVIGGIAIMLGNRFFDIVQPSDNAIMVGGAGLALFDAVVFIALIIAIGWFSSNTTRYSKYTEKGIKMAIYLEGLERYIKLAEQGRLEFLQSTKGADTSATGMVNLYEKLLPWACLFGVEKSWATELNHYYDSATTDRNQYDPTLNPALMHGIIAGNMIKQINRNLNHSTYYASSSSSSGSSGSSGGGFSGGGGGGGGGGGW